MPRSGWDRLDDQQRRAQLDAMDPDAVRAMATSMPVIEQAKGILMGCFGCDPAAAFAVLVRVSAARNVKLRELASLVVDAAGRQEPGTTPLVQVQRVLTAGPDAVDDGRGYHA